jgi:LAS superfamily LD-carboxypeptidase LdcB
MSKKVAWDYIVPVVLPKDLKGIEPGKLPANLLVPAVGGGKMHHIAAKAWAAMVAAAKAEGVELKPTSAGDTYRDYETQKKGFLTRYQLEPIPGQSTKTFEGKTWYLKKGMAMLATPGKSQHNLGIAVDVANAAEPKRLNWLIANVKKFGFSWEVVPSEPWHLRYVCGDNIPEAVASFQG